MTTAIQEAIRAGTAISVSGIARQAGVDRTFLYRHRDLLALIQCSLFRGTFYVHEHQMGSPPRKA
ncbi:hypothetical protein ACFYSF_34895 [Streptomyces canus]|uniref:hypothetical protein n=1 Tax=Streptomyces canus TaxID=58343 RepID=UPI0036A1B222